MTAAEFVRKWKGTELSERSACQQHFLDLCALLEHPTPAAMDRTGERFTFERGAEKRGGGSGWADVWKKGYFGWEYKKRRANLDKAYDQLLLYREHLENPPLLVVSDMDIIEVHTNFTNAPPVVHRIALDELDQPRSLEILRAVFHDPKKLLPGKTSAAITEEAARRVGELAQALRSRGEEPHAVARFLDRLVFCFFAEDIGLLRLGLFTELLTKAQDDPATFERMVGALFEAMETGGFFGVESVRRFNGSLFEGVKVLHLERGELYTLREAACLDWSAVDPSVFGTLFERGLDPAKRSQLGAHYTSREDIETLVEPVVMAPLRREWEKARDLAAELLAKRDEKSDKGGWKYKEETRRGYYDKAVRPVRDFLEHLASVRVLDPACGSGNFLYVTLQKLKDLEKEAVVWAGDQGLPAFLHHVHPRQLLGIEVNPYAYELAQMTVWIGYLQWIRFNGYGSPSDPVLERMEYNFQNCDAILNLSDPNKPQEPEWPEVDFIVGNPPFLGTKRLRSQLGDEYVEALFSLYGGRIPNFSDLCCYWFEKARAHIEAGKCQRAGLLATQGIRGGLNRTVLNRIKESGDIFFAESDRPWILDGANVHVSMVGFDRGKETLRFLDQRETPSINSNLTACADITSARRLPENQAIGYYADVKSGKFDISDGDARGLLLQPNPNGNPTSDVLFPYAHGLDVLGRIRYQWVIDFGVSRPVDDASRYEGVFAIVCSQVKPERQRVKRARYRDFWWLHAEPCPEMRRAITPIDRFLVTPITAKHRVFAWLRGPLLPDHAVFVIARADDYFFGVLHSRFHEVWARAQGTQLREATSGARYTPTTCFETFPFPWAPGEEPKEDPRVVAISEAAKELDRLRQNWLNPPEWTKEEILEFPGSADGPWARFVTNPDARGIGTVRYPRLVAKDADCAAQLKKRTLTNLYNQRPTWLDLAHQKLDAAVAVAYGWPADLTPDQILEKLLALNLELAGGARESEPAP